MGDMKIWAELKASSPKHAIELTLTAVPANTSVTAQTIFDADHNFPRLKVKFNGGYTELLSAIGDRDGKLRHYLYEGAGKTHLESLFRRL